MALPPPRRPEGNNPQKPAPKAPLGKLPPLPKVDIPQAEPETTSQAAVPQKRPPTGEQRAPAPRPQAPQGPSGKRNTQMLSLEPPKRQDGPRLAPGARMDGIGARMRSKTGPTFSNTRMVRGKDDKADLFGRKKTDELAKRPPTGEMGSLGGSSYDPNEMMARRKGTRRVPKPGGGVMGDNNRALDSMTSDRRPAVPPPPSAQVMPPVSALAKGPDVAKRPDMPPPPPSVRGSTLAGVSAEELLGAEGKALMDQVKRREHERRGMDYDTRKVRQGTYGEVGASRTPTTPQQRGPIAPIPISPLPPMSAAPVLPIPVQPQPYVAQPAYVPPPPQFPEAQTYAPPAPQAAPPSDDLGYEKPVDFGTEEGAAESSGGETVYEEDEVSAADLADDHQQARESAAHEEMEQLVGYMLWLQGVITVEEVEEALKNADPKEAREEIMSLLNNSGFTGQESLYRFLARHESVAPVDLGSVIPTESALGTLRPAVARAYRVIPISVLGKILLVAAAMPFEPQRLLELRSLTGRKVKVFVTSSDEIDAALKKYYPGGQKAASGRQGAVAETTSEIPKPVAPGEKLEQGYDPTVAGHDSGLYAPVSDKADAPEKSANVALEEQPGTTPVTTSGGFSATDSTAVAREDAAARGDLDESTLGSTPDPLGDDNELKLGEDAASGVSEKKPGAPIDSGPEDLDPFGD